MRSGVALATGPSGMGIEWTGDAEGNMEKIECSVWYNSTNDWGLTILGGPNVRDAHFDRARSPVFVELSGTFYPCNVDKDSFWKSTSKRCIHLINVNVKKWADLNGLHSGDHVWLEIIEPYRRFRAIPPPAVSREVS
jgi:hypothetical protein